MIVIIIITVYCYYVLGFALQSQEALGVAATRLQKKDLQGQSKFNSPLNSGTVRRGDEYILNP
jgi:hypothetical protein